MADIPFVLPAGVTVELSDTLTIRYAGSVEIEQTFGRPIHLIEAGGDAVVSVEPVTGSVRAGGRVVISGRVDADLLHGNEVLLTGGEIKCRAISADTRIVIGAAKLHVDVIIAPEVVIDPKASGRVTVIESKTEVGPTKIKGGFSLAEYQEAVGEIAPFLEERGLTDLAARMASSEAPVPAPAPPRITAPPPAARKPTGPMTAPPPANMPKAVPLPPVVEDVGDPMSLSVEDLEPVQIEIVKDELHPKLLEAVKRIAACYEGKEMPPAVDQLRELIDGRDYDRLRDNITEVWNGLLGYHQKKGIRPHHQVTHAFNVIHGLVQQG